MTYQISLAGRRCLRAVAVEEAQEASQARAVQVSVEMVLLQVVAHRQPLTQGQAVAVTVRRQLQAAQAVAELFTLGLRFNNGTFCASKQR
jgi:hypothetical protein